jgi:CRP-like cAMP-binding protein
MPDQSFQALILSSEFGKVAGEAVCAEILKAADRQHWPEGSMVFQEGDAASGMYFVAKGMIKLVRISADGRESILTFVEPPNMFAEAAVFIGKYPVTAMTMADTELLFLHKQKVMELVSQHESFLSYLFGAMARWLQRLVSKIDQLTLSDGTARVARYLLTEFERTKPDLSHKIARIILSAKKGDLATLLNMNQPSLSRIFRRLQDDHLIKVEGKTIYLYDLEALRKLTLPPLE